MTKINARPGLGVTFHGMHQEVRFPLNRSPGNRVLAGIEPKTLELLKARLTSVELSVRAKLEERNKKINHVYFIYSGLASVVAIGPKNQRLEIGIFGRDGFSGISVLLGAVRSPHETYMQISGAALKMEVDVFLRAIEQHPDFRMRALEFARQFNLQVAHTALVTAHWTIADRLALWLLMASERTGLRELPLTHEFLSLMLGVGRSGVTIALQILKGCGAIATERGVILIVDYEALLRATHGAYCLPRYASSQA